MDAQPRQRSRTKYIVAQALSNDNDSVNNLAVIILPLHFSPLRHRASLDKESWRAKLVTKSPNSKAAQSCQDTQFMWKYADEHPPKWRLLVITKKTSRRPSTFRFKTCLSTIRSNMWKKYQEFCFFCLTMKRKCALNWMVRIKVS